MTKIKKEMATEAFQEITKEVICKLKKPAATTQFFKFNDSLYSDGQYIVLRDYANIPVEMQEMLYHRDTTGSLLYFDAKLDSLFEKAENVDLSTAGTLLPTNCSFEDTVFLKDNESGDVVPISKANYSMFKKYTLLYDADTNLIIFSSSRSKIIGYCLPQQYNAEWEETIAGLFSRPIRARELK